MFSKTRGPIPNFFKFDILSATVLFFQFVKTEKDLYSRRKIVMKTRTLLH